MHVAFDFDGCVADTADYIRRAYKAAGVVAPQDILAQEGRPWIQQQLGCDDQRASEIKAAKREFYLEYVKEFPPSLKSPFYAAVRLYERGHHVSLLSAAPYAVLEHMEFWHASSWPFADVVGDTYTEGKVRWMRDHGTSGVYIDDQPLRYDLPDGWMFIHYHGHSTDGLLAEVQRCRSALELPAGG